MDVAFHDTRLAHAEKILTDEHAFLRRVVLACAAVKTALVLIDPTMRLFLGDSATYLWSAVHLDPPPDRSFTYPLLIRLTAGVTGSLPTLLWVQTAIGVATAALVCRILRDHFGVRRAIAAGAALLVAIEPGQLFYERMVMTETASTFALIAGVAFALAYLRTGSVRSLLACVGFGLLLASLRVGLVPVALLLGIVAVVIRWRRDFGVKNLIGHLALAVGATVLLHGGYQLLYGWGTHSAPAYIRDGGLFRLGLVAPLVKAEHFRNTGVDGALLDDVRIPLASARTREAQIWHPGGLVDVLRQHAGSQASAIASLVAERAIRDDPLGLLKLGLETTREYFDRDRRKERLWSDLGSGQLPDPKIEDLIRTSFHYNVSGIATMPSPVYRYFAAAELWTAACLFALLPLAIAAAVRCRGRHGRGGLLLALLAGGFVIGQILCSHIISFRYLHPFPVLVILCGALLVQANCAARENKKARMGGPFGASG
ncbi:MAG TPA: hypothetical protein VF132_02380 [Rudaea sp.]